jgi:thiamine-monophosphate kinase
MAQIPMPQFETLALSSGDILSPESGLERSHRPMKHGPQTEDSILRRIVGVAKVPARRFSGGSIALGIGDDAALLPPKPGREMILTCDWFLEGTHFLRGKHPPDAVGWKSLARAVSDVAAMGGAPRCFLLSLALPETHTGPWLDGFLGGLRRASRKFKCALAGGDTTRRQEILISVTVVGEVRAGHAVLRSGARPGDTIFVSGRLGEAELGLQTLKQGKGHSNRNYPPTSKHLYPEPRLSLGQWLAEKRVATAMMDLSDGLSSDLPRLCSASGVGARVERARIPLVHTSDGDVKSGVDPMQLALHGGDDYELLFTVSRPSLKRLPKSFQGIPLTPIGEITRAQRLLLVREDGHEQLFISGGWDPFRRSR